MIYTFELNGDDITKNVEIGASIRERLAEELDIGKMNVMFTDQETEYQMFGLVTIKITDDDGSNSKEYNMIIMNDKVEATTKTNPPLYNHELDLIELTHALDYEVVNMLSFTQPTIQEHLAPFKHTFDVEIPDEPSSNENMDYVWENIFTYSDGDISSYSGTSEFVPRVNFPEHPFIYNKYRGSHIVIESVADAKIYGRLAWGDKENRKFKGTASDFEDEFDMEFDSDYIDIYDSDDYEAKEMRYYEEVPIQLRIRDDNETIIYEDTLDSDVEFEIPADGKYYIEYGLFDYDDMPSRPYANGSTLESSTIYQNYVPIRRFYQYEVSTAYFEPYTMYDFVNRIIKTTPLRKAKNVSNNPLFNLNPELEERLRETQLPQLFLNKLTVREALNIGFRYINAVIRLEKSDNNFELNANFFNERKDEIDFDLENYFSFTTEQNTKDYITTNRSFMSRTINTNETDNPSKVEPSSDTYKGLRSQDIQVTPDNAKLITDDPIYRLLNIKVKVNLKLIYHGAMPDTGIVERNVEEEIDITPRVREENIYQVLDVANDYYGGARLDQDKLTGEFFRNYKNENASYRFGGYEIDFSKKFGEFLPRTHLVRLLHASLVEHLQFRIDEHIQEYDNDGYYADYFLEHENGVISPNGSQLLDEYDENSPGRLLNGTNDDAIPLDVANTDYLQNVGFQLSYITHQTEIHDAFKENTEGFKKTATQIMQQREQAVNFERAGVANYGMAQRLGVPTQEYSEIKEKLSDFDTIADYDTDGRVIVETETVLHNFYAIRNYEFSRDFNRLAQYIGVDREYRPYELPSINNTLERQDIYNEFLEFHATDTEPEELEEDDTYIYDRFFETYLNTLVQDEDKPQKFITASIVKTDGFEREFPDNRYNNTENEQNEHLEPETPFALLIPAVSKGSKNALSFSINFNHNQVAGDRTVFNGWKDVFGTDLFDFLSEVKWQGDLPDTVEEAIHQSYGLWREFVRYTDENGMFKYFHFRLIDELPFIKTEGDDVWKEVRDLPLLKSRDGYFEEYSDHFMAGSKTESYTDGLYVEKDPSEIYKFKYQVSTIPEDEEARKDVIFGKKFFSENYTVAPNKNRKLYLYLHDDENDKYLTFDIENVKSYVDSQELSPSILKMRDFGYELNYPTIRDYTHWSIGDEDGNLFLAVNSTKRYVVFKRKEERSNIETIFDTAPYDIIAFGNDEADITYSIDVVSEEQFIDNLSYNVGTDDDTVVSLDWFGEGNDYADITYTVSTETEEETLTLKYTVSTASRGNPENSYDITVTENDEEEVTHFIAVSDEEETVTLNYTVNSDSEDSPKGSYHITVSESDEEDVTYSITPVKEEETVTLSYTVGTASEETTDQECQVSVTENDEGNVSYTIAVDDNEETVSLNRNVNTDDYYDYSVVDEEVYANEWDYIGTSGDYDESVNAGSGGTSCRTSSEIESWLDSNYPADDYLVGHVMRVTHARDDGETVEPCTTYYYEAIE